MRVHFTTQPVTNHLNPLVPPGKTPPGTNCAAQVVEKVSGNSAGRGALQRLHAKQVSVEVLAG